MKTKLLVTVSALILSGSLAFAQEVVPEPTPVEAQISELRVDGFSRFEVKTGLTQTKIEAINPVTLAKLEIVIDSATGFVLSEEAGTAGIFENKAEGVFYRTRNRDFVEVDDNGADSSDDSDDSNDDNSEDDNSDDDNGADTSGNSSDDDSSGGSSSSGNDDN
jgi:hypothetical protein